MNARKRIAIIAMFTSLALATDYALTPLYNVKLIFTLVFASAYSFGFKIGAAVAVLAELIWGIISPEGFGGMIIPFLLAATLIYAVAGWSASKVWGTDIKPVSSLNIFFGSILALCAFAWDTITNFATGLLVLWPNHLTLSNLLLFEVNPFTIYFMISHELSDFVIGSTLAPIMVVYFSRVFGRKEEILSKQQFTLKSQFLGQGEEN